MIVRAEILKTKQNPPNPSWDFLLSLCICIVSGYHVIFPLQFGFVELIVSLWSNQLHFQIWAAQPITEVNRKVFNK